MEYLGFVYNLVFALVGLAGALLFTWWWITVGRTSDVYAYMTAFMYGVVLTQGISLYARHISWGVHYHANELINTWWFVFRTLPEFLAVGAIVVTMTVRTIVIIRNSRKPRRPRKERRSFTCDLPHPGVNPFEEYTESDVDGGPVPNADKPEDGDGRSKNPD